MRNFAHSRWALAALLAAMALGAPDTASAALAPCSGARGLECGTVTVPLDRSGALPGTIDLFVERLPARGHSLGTIFALAGGPGDSATGFLGRRRDELTAALRGYDIVAVDQRGTGRSGLINCPELERGDPPEQAVPACAQRIGPGRSLYTTRDSAEDLDAVRAALGLSRIGLYGVSYGTYTAQVYARLHPDRVSALVLDSVVSQQSVDDPFALYLFRALPRVTRAPCAQRRCAGITADPYSDLTAVAARLKRGPLRGRLVDAHGRAQRADLTIASLALTALSADVNPWLRSELPAALHEARVGRPDVLLRLASAGATSPASNLRQSSAGLFAATSCEESTLPWERTLAPGPERLAEAQRRLAAIPAATFAPAPPALVLFATLVPACEWWPNAVASPAVRAPLPDVPALLLAGTADLRTPLEDAREVGAELPHGVVFAVPGAGHGTLESAASTCARRAVPQFLRGRRPGRCTARETVFRAVPAPPASLAATPPAPAVRGRPGRTLTAALLTAADGLRHVRMLDEALRFPPRSVGVGGLLGGTVKGGDERVVLSGAELVSGVRVSGSVSARSARLKVGGTAAAAGFIRVARGRVAGRLGGRGLHRPPRPAPGLINLSPLH